MDGRTMVSHETRIQARFERLPNTQAGVRCIRQTGEGERSERCSVFRAFAMLSDSACVPNVAYSAHLRPKGLWAIAQQELCRGSHTYHIHHPNATSTVHRKTCTKNSGVGCRLVHAGK